MLASVDIHIRKTACTLVGTSCVFRVIYFVMKSITVAMVKIAAKKTNDTTNPTPESIASLRLDWTFFSNSCICNPS